MATGLGVIIDWVDIDPITALFWAAVVNGIASVPLMIVMMMIAEAPRVVGRFTLPRGLRFMGWLATAVMAFAVGTLAIASLS